MNDPPLITPKELEKIGRALYGRLWKHPLAQAIGTNDMFVLRAAHPEPAAIIKPEHVGRLFETIMRRQAVLMALVQDNPALRQLHRRWQSELRSKG